MASRNLPYSLVEPGSYSATPLHLIGIVISLLLGAFWPLYLVAVPEVSGVISITWFIRIVIFFLWSIWAYWQLVLFPEGMRWPHYVGVWLLNLVGLALILLIPIVFTYTLIPRMANSLSDSAFHIIWEKYEPYDQWAHLERYTWQDLLDNQEELTEDSQKLKLNLDWPQTFSVSRHAHSSGSLLRDSIMENFLLEGIVRDKDICEELPPQNRIDCRKLVDLSFQVSVFSNKLISIKEAKLYKKHQGRYVEIYRNLLWKDLLRWGIPLSIIVLIIGNWLGSLRQVWSQIPMNMFNPYYWLPRKLRKIDEALIVQYPTFWSTKIVPYFMIMVLFGVPFIILLTFVITDNYSDYTIRTKILDVLVTVLLGAIGSISALPWIMLIYRIPMALTNAKSLIIYFALYSVQVGFAPILLSLVTSFFGDNEGNYQDLFYLLVLFSSPFIAGMIITLKLYPLKRAFLSIFIAFIICVGIIYLPNILYGGTNILAGLFLMLLVGIGNVFIKRIDIRKVLIAIYLMCASPWLIGIWMYANHFDQFSLGYNKANYEEVGLWITFLLIPISVVIWMLPLARSFVRTLALPEPR